ncbi:hypothetical protein AKJ09_08781 [Labilithrix luteola]|uniref:Uncharacterized protein n=1 Tax=Labilithrix luteola TaxID=1391654 RepID=A0A0K1Q8P6_9BACT|nr:hypothetical protein [Labilithrix luteola]AKV02118.1 hypothetical protein AKJ09_08781 [Labilithrix luteola]
MFARTLVAPFDAVRSIVLRLVLAVLGTRGPALLADRSLRVAVYAAFGLFIAAGTTIVAPLWAFALGPLVLGVPHLLADVRYLVVHPALHRRTALAFAVGVPLVAATALVSPVWGLCASFGAIAFARAPIAHKLTALPLWALVVFAAWRHPLASTFVLVHGHNVVAIALFALVFARHKRATWVLVSGFLGFSLLFVSGAADPLLLRPSAVVGPSTGLELSDMIDTLAPVSDPLMGARLAFFFVFAQGVHYLVWLRLVPEEARERPGLRSFASSLRALRADVGLPILGLAVLATVVIGARAMVSLEDSRMLYLRIAGAHAYLEIAFALLFLLEGRSLLGRMVPPPGRRRG